MVNRKFILYAQCSNSGRRSSRKLRFADEEDNNCDDDDDGDSDSDGERYLRDIAYGNGSEYNTAPRAPAQRAQRVVSEETAPTSVAAPAASAVVTSLHSRMRDADVKNRARNRDRGNVTAGATTGPSATAVGAVTEGDGVDNSDHHHHHAAASVNKPKGRVVPDFPAGSNASISSGVVGSGNRSQHGTAATRASGSQLDSELSSAFHQGRCLCFPFLITTLTYYITFSGSLLQEDQVSPPRYTASGTNDIAQEVEACKPAAGVAVHMTDDDLVELLRKPPKSTPALRTKMSFQQFFHGIEARRIKALLSRAYSDIEDLSERTAKIDKRMDLLHGVLT